MVNPTLFVIAAVVLVAFGIIVVLLFRNRKRLSTRKAKASALIMLAAAASTEAVVLHYAFMPLGGSGNGGKTVTIRPMGDGSKHELYPQQTTNWQQIDDEGEGDTTTYVYTSATNKNPYTDLYETQNFTLPSYNKIDKVTVYIRVRSMDATWPSSWYINVKTHAEEFSYYLAKPPLTYTLYSKELVTNPYTLSAWTEDEVNELEIGEKSFSGWDKATSYYPGRCTQTYAIVTYSPLPYPKYDRDTVGVNTTYIGMPCNFTANWSTPEGSLSNYVFGTNVSGTGWVNTTYSFSGSSWSCQVRTLPSTREVRVEWQIWTNNTEGYWNNTGLQFFYTSWNGSKTISWIFDNLVGRMVNDSFPYVKQWNERDSQTNNVCDAELLSTILAYNYEDNITYLDYAEKYATWLSGQPICRLWQTYNLTSHEWDKVVYQEPSGRMLTLLAQLAIYNKTFESLVQSAIKNFTDIFVPSNTSRGYDIRYVNGSVFKNIWGNPLEYTSIQQFVYSIMGVAYAGFVLDNATWKQKGIDMMLNYSVSDLDIPYHQINQTGHWYGGIPSKEDASCGMYLLAAGSVYAITENNTVKQRIENVSKAVIKRYWIEDRKLFIYQVEPDTGSKCNNLSVHGFGALDEGLLQASLICDNSTWRQRAIQDYYTMVMDERILYNDLICHAVWWNSTHYWINATYHHDSDMYWNMPSHRASYIFYATNITGLYHNQTFLNAYTKLYAAQNAHHKQQKGFNFGINVTTFDFVSKSAYNYMERYDFLCPFYHAFRCFAPTNLENIAVNNIINIYQYFGNPLTGGFTIEPPHSSLSEGWNEITTWNFDVGKITLNGDPQGRETVTVRNDTKAGQYNVPETAYDGSYVVDLDNTSKFPRQRLFRGIAIQILHVSPVPNPFPLKEQPFWESR